MIHPDQQNALRSALDAYEKAQREHEQAQQALRDQFVNVMQAGRRILLLCDGALTAPPSAPKTTAPAPTPAAPTYPRSAEMSRSLSAQEREVSQARASGFSGDMCGSPTCGSFLVRRKGSCLGCDVCGWTGGCS